MSKLKTRSSLAIILLVIILIVIFLSSGQKINNKTNQSPLPTTLVDHPKEIPNNWKIFTNTTYQYSLKYPNTLNVEPFCGKNEEILISSKPVACGPGSYGINAFRIIVYSGNKLNNLLRPGPDESVDPSTTFVDTNINIDNINGTMVSWINKQNEVIYQQVILFNNNKTYRIENMPIDQFKESVETFNQIISSFKFIK